MKSLDSENIDSENSLCLIFNDVDAYIIEENNRYNTQFLLPQRITKKY